MSTKQRLVMTLAGNGVPVDTVEIAGMSAKVTYMAEATDDQRKKGEQLLEAFDWSEEADMVWLRSQDRARAKAMLVAAESIPLATRAACYALMVSLQECREKVNEVIAAVKDKAIEPLATGDSYAKALETVAQIIDAGIA